MACQAVAWQAGKPAFALACFGAAALATRYADGEGWWAREEFLRLNGVEPKPDGPEWGELVLAIAAGSLDGEQATIRLRELLPTGN